MNPSWTKYLFVNDWARSLPEAIQSRIAASVTSQTLTSGDEIIEQGEPFAGLICLLQGEMRVVGTAPCGGELLIGILRQGDWTGFLAALDGKPYAFSVRAVCDCRVARLNATDVEKIFEIDLATFKLLLRPELSVSRANYRYLVEIAYQPPIQRLAERLMGLGRWPYSAGADDFQRLEKISQADLANATRLSRQTINSCLQRMSAHGLVKLGYRTVQVMDPRRLGLLASGEFSLE